VSQAGVAVTVTHLELRSLTGLVPARRPVSATLIQARLPSPEFARFLYTAVGGDWYWRDRLPWTWEQWRAHLASPGRELWYAALDGTPVGYFELDATTPPSVEIAYFGLLPAFVGRGLGGWLLDQAARRGFALGQRVWLHTCSLDGPAALPNYLARGFVPFRVDRRSVDLPVEPPGPWPGADRPRGAFA
jgi:GNAT superfamily N-acetyltransferase